ncbi:unnamed protein product [Rotaria sp. Silwood1]|nr:unnamed protein product [Rotaria sp. Silwood1]CAF4980998.1 unnamed protein product [Rotaria sp. Silwood1]
MNIMDIVKTTYAFDTNQLPKDVLSFTDEKFYGFVKEILGKTAADLLQIQAINNVPSFLLSNDVCAVIELDIDSKELDELRQKISFSCRDGTCRVKVGIKNDFKYLKRLLLSKLEENGKIKPRQKQTTTKIYSTPSVLTKENHVEFIHTSIKKWVEDTKENVNLDNLELKPGADYTLTITDNDNDLEGSIRCKCGVKIKLRKRDGKFQITNFYKHLRSLTCSMIKEKKNHSQQHQMLHNIIDNNNYDVENNNNYQTTDSLPATPQQSLSQTFLNLPTSSSYRANVSSSSMTKGTKRISSNLTSTYSQQLSSAAKRHKK